MDLVMHATKNADLEKHRTNQKSTRSSTSSHCVSKNASQKNRRVSNCQKNEKRRVARKEERRRGREIYTVFILEKEAIRDLSNSVPAAPRSRLVTTAFKMGCRRIVTLCAFPPSLPLHLTHLRCPHSPTFPVTILLLPLLSFHYIVGLSSCLSPLLCLLYF
jgi:hypothetical protein